MKFEVYKYSDKGPRADNQDSIGVNTDDPFIACIADGVGGSDCGKIAAESSVDLFINDAKSFEYNNEKLIRHLNNKIKERLAESKECMSMATTFTGFYVSKEKLNGVHVGDSRLYILRRNGIKQLTEDHTEAYSLFKKGKLTFEESQNYIRKNILESALQGKDDLKFQLFDFDLEIGDRILLTTDGVHGIVTKLELRDLSLACKKNDQFGKAILKNIHSKKVVDNFSFVLLEVQ